MAPGLGLKRVHITQSDPAQCLFVPTPLSTLLPLPLLESSPRLSEAHSKPSTLLPAPCPGWGAQIKLVVSASFQEM